MLYCFSYHPQSWSCVPAGDMVVEAGSKTHLSDQTLPLTTFYSGWGMFQQNLVDMISRFPASNWRYQPAHITGP
jgi:hypothetical protein